MQLFGRTGGYYLFWASAVYFTAGMINIFVYQFCPTEVLQILWLAVLAFPFTMPEFGRWLNMDITWDKKMFDWFKSREERKAEYNNVVPFPAPQAVPHVEPPALPKEPKIYYTLGVTDRNRVSFQMGYSTLTMNKEGCQNLIEQITVFMNQIEDEDESDTQ